MDFRVLVLPELHSMVIVLVSVFILYLILRKFLYKPVTDFMSARQERITSNMDEAKLAVEEANQLKMDYETRLLDSKAEGQEIIEAARKRGAEIQATILEEARQEAQTIKERARREIEREKEKAFEDLKDSTGNLALLIASKLIDQEMTDEKQLELIDKYIDEVGSAKWLN